MDQLLHRFSEIDRLQLPHDLVIEVHRPRQVVDCRLTLQHEGADALQPEKVGKHRTHGPAADDYDIGFMHLVVGSGVFRHDVSSRAK